MKKGRSHNHGRIFSAEIVRPPFPTGEHSPPKRKIFVVRRTLWTRKATRTRQIFVFDDHPESLRLASAHVGIPGPGLAAFRSSSWGWIVAVVAIVGALAGVFWPLL